MVRLVGLPLLGTLLLAVTADGSAFAQTVDDAVPAVSESPASFTQEPEDESSSPSELNFLKTLPHPPDVPASLSAPAAPFAAVPVPERPYFQPDPLLDPASLGQLGWFANVEVGIVKPVLESQLLGTVTFPNSIGNNAGAPALSNVVNTGQNSATFPNGNVINSGLSGAAGTTINVGLPAAKLYWTASPRFEVGYRLPSGFGGISLAYRYLVSEGSSPALSADGPAMLKSRLDYNLADLAWTSREYTPWKWWEMRVRFGLRYVSTYFDTQAFVPVAEAMAGDTIYFSRNTASYVGIGPLAGLDLTRRLNRWGMALSGRLDLSSAIGRERQNFFASTTVLGPNGLPQNARTIIASSQAMPIVNARAGLNWMPPTLPTVNFFAGYQFEYVWHAGELTIIPDTGNFWDQGAVLRFEWNY